MDGETLTVIVVIGLSVILMFVFPLMTMADREDDISQLAIETAITEFVDDVGKTGVLSEDKLSKLEERLSSIGGTTYNLEMKAGIRDENQGKKTAQAQTDKAGENSYYYLYTAQLEDMLEAPENKGTIVFKKDDMFMASIKNASPTFKEQLDNWIYKVTGNDYSRAAEQATIITVDGKK